MFTSKSNRKYKKFLNSNPDCCVIATPSGLAKVMRAQFPELIRLAAFLKITERIGKVRDGWAVIWNESGFHAYRLDAGRPGPSIWTNAQLIEQHAIYATEGKALSLEERQREAASAYGLQVVFERAD